MLEQTQVGWHNVTTAILQRAPVRPELLWLFSDTSYQNTAQANTEASHH